MREYLPSQFNEFLTNQSDYTYMKKMVMFGFTHQLTAISPLRLIPPLPVWSRAQWSLTFCVFISSLFLYSDMSTDLNGRKFGVMSCHNSWCHRHLTIFTSRRQTKARTTNKITDFMINNFVSLLRSTYGVLLHHDISDFKCVIGSLCMLAWGSCRSFVLYKRCRGPEF